MGAGCWLFDNQGRILILKPTYKDHWLLPGGVIEANESPRQACIREVKEETGIDCQPTKLIYIDYVSDRYQSVTEVLQALEALNNRSLEPDLNSTQITDDHILPPSPKSFNLTTAIGISLILAILAVTAYCQRINLLSIFNPACTPKTGDHLSCGEEILYAASKSNERKKAANAIKEGDYKQALKYYQSSWQQDGNDAETLIYMNNAWLEASNADYYTLAVAAPLSYKQGTVARNYELGEYILRGVAQAQTAVNLSLLESEVEAKYNLPGQGFLKPRPISNQKLKGLKIVIADDRNSEDESEKMAPTIAAKPKILGLIGHYTSNVTLGAVDTYEKAQLAEVSFGSTTTDLSDENPRLNFFRVVCSTFTVPFLTTNPFGIGRCITSSTLPIPDSST